MSRQSASLTLKGRDVGAFVLRESATQTGSYALSVRVPKYVNPSGVTHYLVDRRMRVRDIRGGGGGSSANVVRVMGSSHSVAFMDGEQGRRAVGKDDRMAVIGPSQSLGNLNHGGGQDDEDGGGRSGLGGNGVGVIFASKNIENSKKGKIKTKESLASLTGFSRSSSSSSSSQPTKKDQKVNDGEGEDKQGDNDNDDDEDEDEDGGFLDFARRRTKMAGKINEDSDHKGEGGGGRGGSEGGGVGVGEATTNNGPLNDKRIRDKLIDARPEPMEKTDHAEHPRQTDMTAYPAPQTDHAAHPHQTDAAIHPAPQADHAAHPHQTDAAICPAPQSGQILSSLSDVNGSFPALSRPSKSENNEKENRKWQQNETERIGSGMSGGRGNGAGTSRAAGSGGGDGGGFSVGEGWDIDDDGRRVSGKEESEDHSVFSSRGIVQGGKSVSMGDANASRGFVQGDNGLIRDNGDEDHGGMRGGEHGGVHGVAQGVKQGIIQGVDYFYKINGLDKEFPSLSALVVHHSIMQEFLPCLLNLRDPDPE